jgi:hypothetical protein
MTLDDKGYILDLTAAGCTNNGELSEWAGGFIFSSVLCT